MTEKERVGHRKMLVEKRDQLCEEVIKKLASIRRDGILVGAESAGGDTADIVSQDQGNDADLVYLEIKDKDISRYNDAIRRLDENKYGFCYSCGEKIGLKRLNALHFAIRCKDCEEAREVNTSHSKRSFTSTFFQE